ncbi:MAG TPA: aromatic amino acid lyase, partial [Geminicoccaceae bacterium]|nr:aromatic amino acid lyase [Geminicoccaceae bacterium]
MDERRILVPGALRLDAIDGWLAAAPPLRFGLDAGFWPRVDAAARLVAEAAAGEAPVYGVNTGFGRLARVRIPPADIAELQRRLVLSHMCGVGAPLDDRTVRLVLLLKAASLGLGRSGVRRATVEALLRLLGHDALPVVPGQGSVGASGDLAPLAHVAGALIGVGRIRLAGREMPATEALAAIGL